MTDRLSRRRRAFAPGAVTCLLLAACSGSSTAANSPSPVASVTSSPTPGAAVAGTDAAAALRRALAATRALRSYRFSAEQTVTGGPAPQITRLTGRVLRPAALTYTLVAGGRTEQFVRLATTTYRRVPPGPYRRLVKASPAVDPLAAVMAVGSRLEAVTSAASPTGTDFSGTLSGTAATAAGVVGSARPAPGLTVPVRLRADRNGRITRLELTAPLQAGSQRLVLRQITTYGGFNQQPPISRPR